MSSQSSTSFLESLNESYTTKCSLKSLLLWNASIYNYVYFIFCMICNDSLCYQYFKLLLSLLLKSLMLYFSVKSLSDTQNKNNSKTKQNFLAKLSSYL